MDFVGQSVFANHTKFSKVGGLKVKKTLEGRLVFDKTGFEFKKSLTEIAQVWHENVRIEYKDIKDIRP